MLVDEFVVLRAPQQRSYVVALGVIDRRALLAFNNGHCHSLAVALSVATGWRMEALASDSGTYEHVLVTLEDGRLADIGGARQRDEVLRPGTRLVPVTVADTEQFPRRFGWVPPDAATAAAWLPALRSHLDAGTPWRPQETLAITYEVASVQLCFSWDGGTHVLAHARPEPGTEWTRVSSMRAVPGQRDDPIKIDFTESAFREAVSRFRGALDPDDVHSRLCA